MHTFGFAPPNTPSPAGGPPKKLPSQGQGELAPPASTLAVVPSAIADHQAKFWLCPSAHEAEAVPILQSAAARVSLASEYNLSRPPVLADDQAEGWPCPPELVGAVPSLPASYTWQ